MRGSLTPRAVWLTPAPSERGPGGGSNEWFAFRATLTVDEGAPAAPLFVAADSKYDLYLNGERVVREGGLKRGPTPTGTYCDRLDVATMLRPGENTVAVLLWYFGRQAFSHRDSGLPGLLVDTDAGMFGEWKARRHPAYFDAGYVGDAYRLAENSVGYDARKELTGWTAAGYDDGGWPAAVAAGGPGCEPWGELEERIIPQWTWSEPREYDRVEERTGDPGDGFVYYHCRLPYNAHFLPAIELEAAAGLRLSVTVAQDTSCVAPAYITCEGGQRHEFPGWLNGEEVIYKVPCRGVSVTGFRFIETGYAAGFSGGFAAGDDVLDPLWLKAQRTLYVTMRDNFMDCPCRERAQWPGDMVVQLGQIPYCLGRAADLLVRKGLLEVFRWQREDGILYGPVPEGNWRMELPAQMLSVVSRYGLWTYYMNTGDRRLLEEAYPALRRYLDIWRLHDNGLVVYRPAEKGEVPVRVDGVEVGTWDWIDWGHRIDGEPALNAWFVLAVDGVRRVAEELGLESDAAELKATEERVRAAMRSAYWNREKGGYVSDGFEHAPDDRVQALMVLCGVAVPEQYPLLLENFSTVEQACPYMERYILEAMIRMGDAAGSLGRMRRRYGSMVRNSSSTLWERFPEASDHPGTINHSWSGGPLTLLSGFIAGFRPIEPGWRRFRVAPRPGDLDGFRCTVPLPQGEAELQVDATGDGPAVALKAPPGTVALVDLRALDPSLEPFEVEGSGALTDLSSAGTGSGSLARK